MNDSVEGLLQKANAYLASGQSPAARAVLELLLSRDPNHVQAHLLLGTIAWRENRRLDAIRHATDAARVVPDEGKPLLEVARALLQIGECVAARECLDRPFFATTTDGDVLFRAAALRQMLEEHAKALELYERAHAAGADGPEYRLDHGIQLSFNGRMSEAETELQYCIDMGTPAGNAYVNLARLRRQTPEHNHLPALDAALERFQPDSEDYAAVQFARYKELEDLGRYDEAWNALAHGNTLMAARIAYDPKRKERLYDGLRKICTQAFLWPVRSMPRGPMPIFIVGMTRSGTTVLDRVLGNHSQVVSAGEIKDFGAQLAHAARQCSVRVLDGRILDGLPKADFAELGARYLAQTQWRADGHRYFVDKFPPNWQVAGLIHRALPQARILHLVRNPMDVCFSNYRAFFGQSYAWSYDLGHLAHYHQQYRRTMAHWHAVIPGQIMDVDYADLVRDPEATARKVFDFCGLAYEEGCVDLSRNKDAVASWSMAQVREGIHANAFREWHPYAMQLMELRATLAG